MSVCVAVTDNPEGQAALEADAADAVQLGVALVVVDLTGGKTSTADIADEVSYEVMAPAVGPDADEVEQVLQVLEDHPDVTRLVVGVRPRSPIGKAILGSIAQRLILEAPVPVLAVKAA